METLTSNSDELHKLVRLPHGCGEQSMAAFMPNLLLIKYLKKVGYFSKYPKKQRIMEQNIERGKGNDNVSSFKNQSWPLTSFTKTGYKRQFQYQLDDHSFRYKDWRYSFCLKNFKKKIQFFKNFLIFLQRLRKEGSKHNRSVTSVCLTIVQYVQELYETRKKGSDLSDFQDRHG